MDPLTHAVTGGSLSILNAKPDRFKIALFAGIIGGILADADIFIRSAENPLLTIQYHRHFTHSLFFVPFGALIAATLCWLFVFKFASFRELYRHAFLGYLTHPFVDAATSYGTHLYWPLTERREAWSIIPIVDPIPTLLLIAGIIIALRLKHLRWLRLCFTLYLLYFGFGFFQKYSMTQSLLSLAESRGHVVERYDVKPSVLQLLVWRTIYESNGILYVDAFQKTPFKEPVHYSGGSLLRFIPEKRAF